MGATNRNERAILQRGKAKATISAPHLETAIWNSARSVAQALNGMQQCTLCFSEYVSNYLIVDFRFLIKRVLRMLEHYDKNCIADEVMG